MERPKSDIKKAVKEYYGKAIKDSRGCCGSTSGKAGERQDDSCCGSSGYTSHDLASLPDSVSSFGCGSPLAFTQVQEGDVILDLGAGAGLDLILAARKVGHKGKAIGLDMTPEMTETCRRNLERAGVKNAEVRQGEMENMPVEDDEVDWIISNCVINLSPDKKKVFTEAYRVLKPGGQMLISDIVTKDLPAEIRRDMRAWVGCIAGALEEDELVGVVESAGFVGVKIVDRQVYSDNEIHASSETSCGCGPNQMATEGAEAASRAGRIASVRLYARKPL
jgi:arsenite methyltransferase